MLILTIDTSTTVSSLGLVNDSELIAHLRLDTSKNKHSEWLVYSLDWLFSSLNMNLKQVELIGIVIGPGSFTALRVGLATAKGLAFPLNIPIVGVNSIEAIAFPFRGLGIPVVAVVPAKRDVLYASIYVDGLPIFPPMAFSYEDLAQEIKKVDRFILAGPAVPKYKDRFHQDFPEKITIINCANYIDPIVIAELSSMRFNQSGPDDIRNLEPIYIKGVDIKMSGLKNFIED